MLVPASRSPKDWVNTWHLCICLVCTSLWSKMLMEPQGEVRPRCPSLPCPPRLQKEPCSSLVQVNPSLSPPIPSFASELITPYFKKVQILKFPLLSGRRRSYKVNNLGLQQLLQQKKREKNIQQEVQQQRKSLPYLSSPLSPASANASPPAQSPNINFAQHTQGNLFTS